MKKVLKSTLLAMTLVSAQQSTFAEDAPKVEAPKADATTVAAPRTWVQVAQDNGLTIAAAVAAMGIGVLAFYHQDEIKKYFESLSPEKLQETKGNLEDEVKKDQSVLSYLTSFLTGSTPAAQPEAAPVVAATPEAPVVQVAPAVSTDAASADVAPTQDADFADATVAFDTDEAEIAA